MKVHRSAFVPPPKVMSAVVHIVPKAAPEGVRAATLERLTGAAFGQRRKMLRQSLKGLEGALEALAERGDRPRAAGGDPDGGGVRRRGEGDGRLTNLVIPKGGEAGTSRSRIQRVPLPRRRSRLLSPG